jgi:hypothetical protein
MRAALWSPRTREQIANAEFANRIANWREYNRALKERGSLTVWVTLKALDVWVPTISGQRGQPTAYSNMVMETCCV